MKKTILLIIGILFISLVAAYTPPDSDAVVIQLDGDYIPPNSDAVVLTFGEAPTDTCTYTSGDWEVNCADNCTISSNVDLDGNKFLITGNGTFTMNANITNRGKGSYAKGSSATARCIIKCVTGSFTKD